MSWGLLQNSLVVAGSTALVAGLVGSVCAICAAALPWKARRICVVLAVAVLVLPPFLISNTWLHYFGLNGAWRGYWNFNLYSIPGTVLLISIQLWPISFLFVLAALFRIDAACLEQEPLLRGWNLLRHLVWPAGRSAWFHGVLITFVLAFNNFTVPALLQTKVFAAEVWLSFNTNFDFFEALGLSLPLIAAPAALLFLVRWRVVRFAARSTEHPHRLWRSRLRSLFPVVAVISGVVGFVALLLPLMQLAVSPRTWTELVPAIRAGQSAAANSLLLALSSAAIVSVAGLLLARWRAGVIGWLFFLVPGVLLGIALIRVFNRPAFSFFYQSAGIVLLGFAVRYFALGWSGARAALMSGDVALRDMVSVLGGSRGDQFRLAVWPQAKPLLLASFYLVFLFCLWEVETLLLIVPPGHETLALRIFNMLHYGHAGQVNALCVWMLLLGVAPLVLAALAPAAWRRGSILLLVPVLLSGCGSAEPGVTRLKSELFASVEVFGSRGTGAGQFNKPRSIAVDREDNFYVVDLTGRVQKFSPDGQFVLSWMMPQTDVGKPKGMVCDLDGNIIVVEPHYSRANHFSPEGKLLAQWGVNGTNPGQLFFPRAAAVNSRGEIYLSEYGVVERIQHFAHRGAEFLGTISRPGTAPGEINRAEGLGVGPGDNLFAADSCNHRVQVFSPEGKLLGIFGAPGNGAGQLSYPYDVRVDSAGLRFVCEFGNSRVQVFDARNRSIEIVGGAGAEPGRMNNPWAIALDSRGNLYVADSQNHRVQKFIRRHPLPPVERHTRSTETALAAR